MACPYFHPSRPFHSGLTRPPLGDAYEGVCHGDPLAPHFPDRDQLRSWCNVGYARGKCPRFQDGPDAVRFAVASDSGDRIRIAYAVEKAFLPYAHGVLEYAGGSLEPSCDAALASQAAAYVNSYLRRKEK